MGKSSRCISEPQGDWLCPKSWENGERFGGRAQQSKQRTSCVGHGITGNRRILFFNENIFPGNGKRDAGEDNVLTVSFFIHFNIFKVKVFLFDFPQNNS